MSEQQDTYNRILDVAQDLVQARGFNAMGYTDISHILGIRNASIHYHFPKKAELGTVLVRRYRQRLESQLRGIDEEAVSPAEQLELYFAVYREVVHEDGKICLCTILAGDYNTLPPEMQGEVRAFFELNEVWLTKVFAAGQTSRDLNFSGTPEQAAYSFLANLEGTMLLMRSTGDVKRLEAIAHYSLETLRAA